MKACQDKIGLELELGWDEKIYKEIRTEPFWDYHSDGSIGCYREGVARELVTSPVKVKNLKKLVDKVFEAYRGVVEANDSMGLHIHQSFKTKQITKVFQDWNFIKFFVEELETASHEGALRGRGNPDETVADRLADALMQESRYASLFKTRLDYDKHIYNLEHRYKAINYCSLRSYQTIETRIFPAFQNAEGVIRALGFTLRVFNKFYKSHKNNHFEDSIEVNTGKETITIGG